MNVGWVSRPKPMAGRYGISIAQEDRFNKRGRRINTCADEPIIFPKLQKIEGNIQSASGNGKIHCKQKAKKIFHILIAPLKMTAGNILLRKERQYGDLEVKGLVG